MNTCIAVLTFTVSDYLDEEYPHRLYLFPHRVIAVQSFGEKDEKALISTEGACSFVVQRTAIDVINDIQYHIAHCGEDLTMQMID